MKPDTNPAPAPGASQAGQPPAFPQAAGSPKLEFLRGLKGSEYRNAWNKLHRERMREVKRAWMQRHPEKVGKIPASVTLSYRAGGKRKLDKIEKYYAGWEKAEWRGKHWDPMEDCMVMERATTDRELSRKLGRSIHAIQARRVRLRKANT